MSEAIKRPFQLRAFVSILKLQHYTATRSGSAERHDDEGVATLPRRE